MCMIASGMHPNENKSTQQANSLSFCFDRQMGIAKHQYPTNQWIQLKNSTKMKHYKWIEYIFFSLAILITALTSQLTPPAYSLSRSASLRELRQAPWLFCAGHTLSNPSYKWKMEQSCTLYVNLNPTTECVYSRWLTISAQLAVHLFERSMCHSLLCSFYHSSVIAMKGWRLHCFSLFVIWPTNIDPIEIVLIIWCYGMRINARQIAHKLCKMVTQYPWYNDESSRNVKIETGSWEYAGEAWCQMEEQMCVCVICLENSIWCFHIQIYLICNERTAAWTAEIDRSY